MYLAQFISQSGLFSRRKAIEIIKMKLIQVDGVTVYDPATKVSAENKVFFQDRPIFVRNDKLTILFFKPPKLACTHADEMNRPTIFDYLAQHGYTERLFFVGRLDYESRGLILLSNDGDWCQKMAHPKYNVPKEYLVLLDKPLNHTTLARLERGIFLEDGFIRPDKICLLAPNKIKILLHSGRNRIIRRIFGFLGYNVLDLLRIRVGDFYLSDMQEGQIKVLKQK